MPESKPVSISHLCFFFFQAEDGIRDWSVTGVQTCALPILRSYLDPSDPTINTSDASELIKIIGDRPSVSFSGHTHTTEHHYFGFENPMAARRPHHHHVMTALSGSWWSGPYDHRGVAVADFPDGNPNRFHILSVDGDRLTTRF